LTNVKSLTHSVWECKYHIVWVPKYRRKSLYANLRRYMGNIFHELANQRESKIVEGHICVDHVHMLVMIPPKYSVAQVVGYIKGKSAIALARNYIGRSRDFTGQNFWARGYYVSTVGLDEEVIKRYIREQEEEDKRLDQLGLFKTQ